MRYDKKKCRQWERTHLHEVGAHVLVAVGHADALASTSLRGLDHDGVADAVGGGESLVEGRDLGLAESLRRDSALLQTTKTPKKKIKIEKGQKTKRRE